MIISEKPEAVADIYFCLERGLQAWRTTTLGTVFQQAFDSLRDLESLVEAARRVRTYDQAGGDEWWKAHADLYAALERIGCERELDGGAE